MVEKACLTFTIADGQEPATRQNTVSWTRKRFSSTHFFGEVLVKLLESAGDVWRGDRKTERNPRIRWYETHANAVLSTWAEFALSVNGAHAIAVPATESRRSSVLAAANVIVAGTAPSDESSDSGADVSDDGRADVL
jgi:hypothetical protein